MFKDLVRFYWSLWAQMSWQPHWLNSRDPDAEHFHRRRFTHKYREKQRIVRSVWFSAGVVMLAFPQPHVVIALLLFTTFLSFCILDETE
ncbi:hypothetical protein HBA55_16275 [Pseudomaricurvus alkylphenolicus]|jgi:hypothetical protein|uniref:hypothetical protein n=1 Tax=Pseudomaricurvus alkylphenolicus TaxID=1306991 RepID=UPI00141DC8C4|nr:hypothetical protein [Pseudomaricurvus alkylphenolicus]NIB41161.1 hypothetical protein [Pseudomaricurvus alkylphenolicus]